LDAVTARCERFTSIRIDADHTWALREFGGDGGFPLDEPEIYELRSLTLALLRAPVVDGCRVVLLGDGGDHVLGAGLYCEPAGLRAVAWQDWRREVQYYHRWSGMSWPLLLLRAYVKPALPDRMLSWLEAWYLKRALQRPWLKETFRDHSRNGCSVEQSYSEPPGLGHSARVVYRGMRHAREVARQSALDVCAAYVGVEVRSPFWDRRLVDFALRIPHRLRAWRGVDRVIARQSLSGTLPEAVRRRLSKSHVGDLVHRGLREEERERVEGLLHHSRAEALGFVDSRVLGRTFERYWRGDTDRYHEIIRPLYLEAWLREGA
jgi:asparagine synthase (glutamine-hydrolysing)